MSLVSLPMYDFPDVRAATDAWWTGVAKHLRDLGQADVPERLTRGEDLFAEWHAPALLLSQTCGYIWQSRLGASVRVVATPHYAAPGCREACYASVIMVGPHHDGTSLADFRGARAAYSLEYSHAGYNAFRGLIAPLAAGGCFFDTVTGTGSHLASIEAIAAGRADLATVDAIVYAFVQRHRPAMLAGTRMLGYTPTAPAPPYITAAHRTAHEVERLRTALLRAVVDPTLAATRRALFIDGFSITSAADYAPIMNVERSAAELHYRELR